MLNAKPRGGKALDSGVMPASRRGVRLTFADYIPVIFVLTLLVPLRLELGPIALSASRILVLMLIVPCLIKLATGSAGRVRLIDVLVISHGLWMWLALVVNHQMGGLEPGGIYFVEAVGCYLVARCFIRSAETFYLVTKQLFICIAVLLPFLIIETLTGRHFLIDLFGLFGPTIVPVPQAPRMGLERAFGVFDHPILMGAFCGAALSLTYYVFSYGVGRFAAVLRSGIVAIAAAATLSSAPLLILMVQFYLIGWQHWMARMRQRWWLLGLIIAAMYVAIDLISNRTPLQVMASRLTFNPHTAYWRMHIWDYGSAEVERHPWFGIGLSDWARPEWMSSDSVDNFWLLVAMKGGLPAFLFLAGGLLLLCIHVGRTRLRDPRLISYRRGWMFTIIALVIAGATVHYWAASFYYFMFLIGGIVWLLESNNRTQIARPAKARSVPPRPRTIPLG